VWASRLETQGVWGQPTEGQVELWGRQCWVDSHRLRLVLLGVLFGGKDTETPSQCIPNPKGALFDARNQAAV